MSTVVKQSTTTLPRIVQSKVSLGLGAAKEKRIYRKRSWDTGIMVPKRLEPGVFQPTLPDDETEMSALHATEFMEQAGRMTVILLTMKMHGCFDRNFSGTPVVTRGSDALLSPHEVTASGAVVQAQRGKRKDGTEAAHLIPRNFQVNARNLWDFLRPHQHFARNVITIQLGLTHVMPAAINKDDTTLETMGGVVGLYEKHLQEILLLPHGKTIGVEPVFSLLQQFQFSVVQAHERVIATLISEAGALRGGEADEIAARIERFKARRDAVRDWKPNLKRGQLLFETLASELAEDDVTAALLSRGRFEVISE